MWLTILTEAALWLGICELIEYFAVRREPGNVYPLKLPWRLAYWAMLAYFFELLRGIVTGSAAAAGEHRGLPALIFGAILLFVRPRSITAGETGVSSCGIFGMFRRFIPWSDVREVSYDWEEVRGIWPSLALFWNSGPRITVRSRAGLRISHTIWNSRQAAFLRDLRERLPRESFDPGVYEMNPV